MTKATPVSATTFAFPACSRLPPGSALRRACASPLPPQFCGSSGFAWRSSREKSREALVPGVTPFLSCEAERSWNSRPLGMGTAQDAREGWELPQNSEESENHCPGRRSRAKPRENPLKWVRSTTGFNRFSVDVAEDFNPRRSPQQKWGNSCREGVSPSGQVNGQKLWWKHKVGRTSNPRLCWKSLYGVGAASAPRPAGLRRDHLGSGGANKIPEARTFSVLSLSIPPRPLRLCVWFSRSLPQGPLEPVVP